MSTVAATQILTRREFEHDEERDYLAIGDEVGLQVLLDDDSYGHVLVNTGELKLFVEYLPGDARTKKQLRPSDPFLCHFAFVPPSRSSLATDGEDEQSVVSRNVDVVAQEEHDSAEFSRLKGTPIVYGQQISLRHNITRTNVRQCRPCFDSHQQDI